MVFSTTGSVPGYESNQNPHAITNKQTRSGYGWPGRPTGRSKAEHAHTTTAPSLLAAADLRVSDAEVCVCFVARQKAPLCGLQGPRQMRAIALRQASPEPLPGQRSTTAVSWPGKATVELSWLRNLDHNVLPSCVRAMPLCINAPNAGGRPAAILLLRISISSSWACNSGRLGAATVGADSVRIFYVQVHTVHAAENHQNEQHKRQRVDIGAHLKTGV